MGTSKARFAQAETELKAGKSHGWNPEFSGWTENSIGFFALTWTRIFQWFKIDSKLSWNWKKKIWLNLHPGAVSPTCNQIHQSTDDEKNPEPFLFNPKLLMLISMR